MTPDNFCYWLQGFFEISGATTMTESQVKMVRNHLDMVFVHAVSQEKVEPKPESPPKRKLEAMC